jgi:spoIIIJ-associated protein
MGADATAEVEMEDREQATINIKGQDLGVIIGRRGQTLGALQHLIGLITTRKTNLHKRVVLDAEEYRARREETLRTIARRAADRAVETGEDVSLDPMPASERRIVHLALADDLRVATRSVGQDPMRSLVVSPKGGAPRQRRGLVPGRRPQRLPEQLPPREEFPPIEEEPPLE